jgi:hypothetical protein
MDRQAIQTSGPTSAASGTPARRVATEVGITMSRTL